MNCAHTAGLEVWAVFRDFHGGINSYDETYGARPIRRYIQSYVETPLASKIIAGEVSKTVQLTADDKGLKFVTK